MIHHVFHRFQPFFFIRERGRGTGRGRQAGQEIAGRGGVVPVADLGWTMLQTSQRKMQNNIGGLILMEWMQKA
jgi:hypothetical protein